MTRKESEKDAERPHYYSQFWLDIAAGRRTIGGPKPEEGEGVEAEIAESVPQRKAPRSSEPEVAHATRSTTGRKEEVTDTTSHDAFGDLDESSVDEDDQDNIPLEDEDIPDMDLNMDEEEENSDESLGEEEEEEDEMNWGGGRGRKKTKPTRSTKTPLKKSGKTRRGF